MPLGGIWGGVGWENKYGKKFNAKQQRENQWTSMNSHEHRWTSIAILDQKICAGIDSLALSLLCWFFLFLSHVIVAVCAHIHDCCKELWMLTSRGSSRLSSADAFCLGLAFGLRGHALLGCLFHMREEACCLAAVPWSLFLVFDVMPVAYVWEC